MDDERRQQRLSLLAWMERMGVDEVVLHELHQRTENDQPWYDESAPRFTLAQLRERWQNDTDR